MWFPNFVALFALEKASLVALMVKCLSACRRHRLNLWEDLLEKEMATHSSILA